MISRVDRNAPKCISIHGIQHKKGFRSLGRSFMAVSGHYWLENGIRNEKVLNFPKGVSGTHSFKVIHL